MEEVRERKIHPEIPLQTVIIAMVVIGVVLSVILAFLMYQTSDSYKKMREATRNYMECQSVANNLLAGSDALTIYARGFVVTGDPQQAELYYTDTRTENTIKDALEEVSTFSTDERVLSQLDYAMQLRDRLSVTEDYAMRLKVAAINGDISEYPEKLAGVQLLPSDELLSAEKQEEKARSLLFDIDYESSKNEISLRINRSMEILMSSMLTKQSESSDRMRRVLIGQHIMTILLILLILAFSAIVFSMVVVPIRRAISKMSNAEELGEEGASEIRFLARTYNELYEQNRVTTEKLNYEATHDGLTGLYNRSAYATILERLTNEGSKMALIVLDVDLFKHINDRMGHDVGDTVLRTVGNVLTESFRSEDMVCRIGGDEFAVIMNHTDSGYKSVISDKLWKAAEKLAKPEGDMPRVTLSVGVAFTDQLTKGAGLFKSADLALYQVKKSGRNGCGFFSGIGTVEIISNMEESGEEPDDWS